MSEMQTKTAQASAVPPAARLEKSASGETLLLPEYYEAEKRWCDEEFVRLRKILEDQTNPAINTELLTRAYEKAKSLHGRVARKSGQLYLRHPLAAAQVLARLHLGTNLIAAALLHDTMEDCGYTLEQMRSEFNATIAEIVDGVTALRKEDVFDPALSSTELHAKVDRLTDIKLLNSSCRTEAFWVRMADREHNLSTLEAYTQGIDPGRLLQKDPAALTTQQKEQRAAIERRYADAKAKQREKIEQTRDFLLRVTDKLEMHYFDTVLGDYCLRYSNAELYRQLNNERNHYLETNRAAFVDFEKQMAAAVRRQEFFSFAPYDPFNNFSTTRRITPDGQSASQPRRAVKPIEILKQLSGAAAATGEFVKQQVYLNELTLTFADRQEGNAIATFLRMFREELEPERLVLSKISVTRLLQESEEQEFPALGGHMIRVILTDELENNYCVKLLPAARLHEYYVGHSADMLSSLGEDDAVEECMKKRITVYSFTAGKPLREYRHLPEGATVLDLAFDVSDKMAQKVKAAQIRTDTDFTAEDHQHPLNTRLNDGDIVHYIVDNTEVSHDQWLRERLEWFNCVKTAKARNRLIQILKG